MKTQLYIRIALFLSICLMGYMTAGCSEEQPQQAHRFQVPAETLERIATQPKWTQAQHDQVNNMIYHTASSAPSYDDLQDQVEEQQAYINCVRNEPDPERC